jgi:hypothetical protein
MTQECLSCKLHKWCKQAALTDPRP